MDIGARVGAMATADEVLVSRTVFDLAAGSGLAFVERGERTLKGVPGSWQLYALDGHEQPAMLPTERSLETPLDHVSPLSAAGRRHSRRGFGSGSRFKPRVATGAD